jgi:hypothetical protein
VCCALCGVLVCVDWPAFWSECQPPSGPSQQPLSRAPRTWQVGGSHSESLSIQRGRAGAACLEKLWNPQHLCKTLWHGTTHTEL